MRKPTTFTLLVAAALASAGATECGQIIDDRGFDLWCDDDRLCVWVVEKGEVRRAATWHSEDAGVELLGDDTTISQLTSVEHTDGHCVRFDLVADVDEAAEVMLELDVYGDGTVEHRERIPTSDWRKLSYLVRMPERYEGVRFRLTKRGEGRAVLANIGAETAKDADCPGDAIVIGARPLGASCTGDGECASAICDGDGEISPGVIWPGVCAACVADAGCTGGQVCARTGTNTGVLEVGKHCVAPASAPIGAACGRDVECASNRCLDNVCVGCRTGADCAGGLACAAIEHRSEGATWPGPRVCGPGAPAGAACVTDAQCASGACAGAPLRLCRLGHRECEVETDCPTFGTDDEQSCVTVGSRGGSCQ